MLVRKQSTRRRMRRAVAREITVILLLAAAGVAVYGEMQTSWLQSKLFSHLAQDLDYALAPGPSETAVPAPSGPYDQRLGYARLGHFAERLQERGFRIEEQARLSARHAAFIAHGGFPIYREKAQAGLSLFDRRDEALFEARYPERIYADLEAVPPLVVHTLLFIENRELLEQRYPTHNPAIEWDRLARIAPGALAQLVDPSLRVAGGSTLATQIEKFRHAEAGRTAGVRDKLRQMVSASVRVYRDGIDTAPTRRRLIVDYLNATPLGAQVGFGEVLGLGDGLHAWFGTDFEHANRILGQVPADEAGQLAQAQVYKQVLGLLLAQRRPAFYLRPDGRDALRQLADWHLRTLAARSVIPTELARAALALSIDLLPAQADRTPRLFEAKAATTLRSGLQATLGLQGTYQLDRLDLEVQTTLDRAAQARVVELLRTAADPAAARDLGLLGHRLLDTGSASDALVLSLTVYERGEGMNLLRVQADNLDGPFDVSRGAKLDLGSTAKLRTLITYLEILAELHGRLGPLPAADLARHAQSGIDPLTRWSPSSSCASPRSRWHPCSRLRCSAATRRVPPRASSPAAACTTSSTSTRTTTAAW